MTTELYPYFCEMMEIELLDRKICHKIREYLLVIGKDYGITTTFEICKGLEQSVPYIRNDSSDESMS